MSDCIAQTATLACGLKAYSHLVVPHDWSPAPLNVCPDCGAEIAAWSIGKGHYCRCGWDCGGACRG